MRTDIIQQDPSDSPAGWEARRWQPRGPRWVAYASLFCLGGPFNPMAWWLGWFAPMTMWGSSLKVLYLFLLMPCILMAGVAVIRLSRVSDITLADIGGAIWAGFLAAVLSSPVVVGLGTWVMDGGGIGVLLDVVQFILIIAVFGWLLGVIPYFAVVYGIPCAISLFLVALCFFKPVRQKREADIEPTRNMDRPRP